MSRNTAVYLLAALCCSCDASSPADTEDGSTSGSETGDPAGSSSAPDPSTTASAEGSESGVGGETTTSGPADTSSTDPSGDETSSTGEDPTGDPPPVGDPRMPGPFGTTDGAGTVDLGLESNVPLTLYLPDDEGPHPVIVLTHGFSLSPSDYVSYGDHLASWGFVVVMPQYPGGAFDPTTHADILGASVQLLDWIDTVADIEAAPLLGRANPDLIGLAGHSAGGKMSFLTAATDGRPDAVFGIDAVNSTGGPGSEHGPDYPSVTPELMPDITVPFVSLGETTNETGPAGQACAPAALNFEQFFTHAQSPALQIDVLGANHMSFLDNPDCGFTCSACPEGTDDPAVTRSITQGYLVAFFGMSLYGEDGWAEYLTGDAMMADVDAGLVTFETANGF